MTKPKTRHRSDDLAYGPIRAAATALHADHWRGAAEACRRIKDQLPFLAESAREIRAYAFSIQDIELVIACEYGFETWTDLKRHIAENVSVSAAP